MSLYNRYYLNALKSLNKTSGPRLNCSSNGSYSKLLPNTASQGLGHPERKNGKNRLTGITSDNDVTLHRTFSGNGYAVFTGTAGKRPVSMFFCR
jgi:hypothetical protein